MHLLKTDAWKRFPVAGTYFKLNMANIWFDIADAYISMPHRLINNGIILWNL